MLEFLKNVLTPPLPTVTMNCFYGAHFPQDLAAVKRRNQKIEAIKKRMGDKYLLHTPKEKLNAETQSVK